MDDFIDVEPLHISTPKTTWSHPEIEDIAEFQQADWTDEPHLRSSAPVYRVYLENRQKKTIYIVFQSDWFDRKGSQPISDTLLNSWIDLTDDDWQEFAASLDMVLREDVWCPGGQQFCTLPIYKEICQLLKNGFRITFLSPDVSLYKEDDGTYGWDS